MTLLFRPPLLAGLLPPLAALLLAAGCAPSSGPADGPQAAASAPRPALTVTAVQPLRQTLPDALPASGNIAAHEEISVGADVNGLRLSQVLVNVGDVVKKGQLLALFDDAPARADEAQARAALAEAQAALDEAAANAGRFAGMAGSGAVSQQEAGQYATAEKTARARVAAARAALQGHALRLRHTRVLAPDGGVISARSATPGQVALPGAELFRMVRQGRLEWRAELTAEQLLLVQPGQAAHITLPGPPGRAPQVQGKVRQLAPTVDEKTRYAIVYVDLPAGGPARAGMYASGQIVQGGSPALTLPLAAVVMRDGHAHVMRLAPASGASAGVAAARQPDSGGQAASAADALPLARVHMQRVQLGRMAADVAEVLQGLPGSATVAVQGAAFLNDGDLVRVAPAPTPAASAAQPLAPAAAPASGVPAAAH